MQQYKLRMNPLKCSFEKFIEFTVYKNGIDIDPTKVKAIQEKGPPTTYK